MKNTQGTSHRHRIFFFFFAVPKASQFFVNFLFNFVFLNFYLLCSPVALPFVAVAMPSHKVYGIHKLKLISRDGGRAQAHMREEEYSIIWSDC